MGRVCPLHDGCTQDMIYDHIKAASLPRCDEGCLGDITVALSGVVVFFGFFFSPSVNHKN